MFTISIQFINRGVYLGGVGGRVVLAKDVISMRVRVEVKTAWENLTDTDKENIRALVEELVLLHQAGFSINLVKRELDSLRAEICPRLLKAVEYIVKHPCSYRCYDDYYRKYYSDIQYLSQVLCRTHPVKPNTPSPVNPSSNEVGRS